LSEFQRVCVIRSSKDYDVEDQHNYLIGCSGDSYEFEKDSPTPQYVGEGTLLVFSCSGKFLGEAPARGETDREGKSAKIPIGKFLSYRKMFLDFVDEERLFGQSEPLEHGRSIYYPLRQGTTNLTKKEKTDFAHFIRTHKLPSRGQGRVVDGKGLIRRLLVEKEAIKMITRHYVRSLGYDVRSVERDNLGWDLEASNGKSLHYLEVKGLSGTGVSVELTPNEYDAMRERWERFKVCIVTNALSNRRSLSIFSCSKEGGDWKDVDDNKLVVKRVSGARLST
jgi:hypothetical protein